MSQDVFSDSSRRYYLSEVKHFSIYKENDGLPLNQRHGEGGKYMMTLLIMVRKDTPVLSFLDRQ